MNSRPVCTCACVCAWAHACVGMVCTLGISCYVVTGDFDSLKFILVFLISPPGLQNCDKRKRMLRDQTGGVLVVELSLRSKLIAQ